MKYIILHGSFGSSEGNWFPWLKNQLLTGDAQVFIPQMPIGVGVQTFESWSAVFDGLSVDEDTVIIAHSIAPVFVCKYLIVKRIKVKKLIFVCGFNNYISGNSDFDAVNSPMYLDNLADVKNYCDDIVCFYSDNDPYVSFDLEKSFANTVAGQQIVIKGGCHLNSESGYDKFEELLELIRN